MKDNTNITTHIEFMVLLVTLLGGFYLLDGKIERCTQAQSARTDKLYEMFCEVQTQMKQDSIYVKDQLLEMKKEQYEFMKENKAK